MTTAASISHPLQRDAPSLAFDASAGWLLQSAQELRGASAVARTGFTALMESMRQGLRFVGGSHPLLIEGMDALDAMWRYPLTRDAVVFVGADSHSPPTAIQVLRDPRAACRGLVERPSTDGMLLLIWQMGARCRYGLEAHAASLHPQQGLKKANVGVAAYPGRSPEALEVAVEWVAGLAVAMACVNVRITQVQASKRENTARRRQGIVPCPSYHVLTIGKQVTYAQFPDGGLPPVPKTGYGVRYSHLARGHGPANRGALLLR